jgi:tetratricopeptide (TPR) repeat protein
MRVIEAATWRTVTTLCLLAVVLNSCSRGSKENRHLKLADGYFRAGEFEKAKIEYLNVLRQDFNNPTAEAQLGLIWFAQGAPLRAYAYLSKAREFDIDSAEVRTKLAIVLADLGENAAAREEALAVLQQSAGEEDALLVLTNTASTPEEFEATEEQLRKIPQEYDIAYHLAWGALATRKRDFAYAESELEQALKLAPNSSNVHLALAQLYALRQNRDKASEEFRIAADLSPPRSVARIRYAEYERQTGSPDKAIAILREIRKQTPDYLSATCLLSETALMQGNYDEASLLVEDVLIRDPQNLQGSIVQAELWLRQGEANKAVEELDHLAKMYPNVPLIDYHLARAFLADGKINDAAAALNEAIAAKPDYTEAVLLLAELNLRASNAPLVVSSMSALLKQQPDLLSAQLLLIEAYSALERFDDAAAIAREQIRASPGSADPYFRFGLILRQQHKTNEARIAFAKALSLAPNSFGPVEQLVELDVSQKNFDAAGQRVEDLAKVDAVAGCYLSGKIYAAEGQFDRALASLHQALQLDPNSSKAFELLIATYLAANRPSDAIAELDAALERDSRNTRALADLAMIYERINDYPKARDAYERLISLTPSDAIAMNNLAYLCAERLAQLDKASELARKARSLQPNNPLIVDTLGWTLYRRGDYGEAFTLLRESAGKLPEKAAVQFHFGMASYMMGETGAAERALRTALGGELEATDKAEAQRRVEFLESVAANKLSISQLAAITERQADDVVGWMRLGESWEREGGFDRAARAYEEALKVNPELLPAAVKLAELNSGPLQNKNAAFDFAKRARDLAPNNPRVAGVLGQIVYQLGNFIWAYSLMQESARQLPDDPKILQDFAWTAYSLGRITESRSMMQRVLQAHPDLKQENDARSFLAMTAFEQNREQLANSEPEIQKILRIDPRYIPALMAKADLQAERGDIKSAIAIYDEVLKRYRDFAPAQKRLAALYLPDPSHVDDAYDLALKARNALPNDPELAKILGEISYKKKEFTYAIQLFQESARHKPLRGTDLYYLGMSQFRASQDSESRKTLEQALNTGLQEPLLGEAKATISELRRREGL